jgi:hypothetical protein
MTEGLLANIEISPREVKELLARSQTFLFVDVREKWEHETSRIEGSTQIPLREIPSNLATLATTECEAWTLLHGCARRAWNPRSPWRAGSNAGP